MLPNTIEKTGDEIFFKVDVSNNKFEATEKCSEWNQNVSNAKMVLLNGNSDKRFRVFITPEKQDLEINGSEEFTVKVEGIKSLDFERVLDFRLFSDQVNFLRPIFLRIPAKDSNEKPELYFGEDFKIIFAGATEPDEIKFFPGENGTFKLFLRNASNLTLHNVRVKVIEAPFDLDVSPSNFEEMKPNEIRSFTVSTNIAKEMELGQYRIIFEINANEFPYSLTKNVWFLVVLENLWLYFYAAISLIVIVLVLLRYKKFLIST